MYSKGSTRTKSPYVAQGSINKNSRVVEQKIANSPDKIGQLKAMVNNNPTSSTSKPKSNITTNIPSNIVDKLKSNDKNPILNSKIEEYKKQKKNGYSRSIDTNIPLNTLTNITLTTKGDTTKKLSSNTKAPMVKYK